MLRKIKEENKEERVSVHPTTPREGERQIQVPHRCPIPSCTSMDCILGLKKENAHMYEARSSLYIRVSISTKLRKEIPFMNAIILPL